MHREFAFVFGSCFKIWVANLTHFIGVPFCVNCVRVFLSCGTSVWMMKTTVSHGVLAALLGGALWSICILLPVRLAMKDEGHQNEQQLVYFRFFNINIDAMFVVVEAGKTTYGPTEYGRTRHSQVYLATRDDIDQWYMAVRTNEKKTYVVKILPKIKDAQRDEYGKLQSGEGDIQLMLEDGQWNVFQFQCVNGKLGVKVVPLDRPPSFISNRDREKRQDLFQNHEGATFYGIKEWAEGKTPSKLTEMVTEEMGGQGRSDRKKW